MGLKGLNENDFLYRVVEDDEDLTQGILPKDPDARRTVEQHIASGSKYSSQYISTTQSLEVAIKWSWYHMENTPPTERESPLRVLKIYISKLPEEVKETVINLVNPTVLKQYIYGRTHRNYAQNSQEVISQLPIPKEAISVLETPDKPPCSK